MKFFSPGLSLTVSGAPWNHADNAVWGWMGTVLGQGLREHAESPPRSRTPEGSGPLTMVLLWPLQEQSAWEQREKLYTWSFLDLK